MNKNQNELWGKDHRWQIAGGIRILFCAVLLFGTFFVMTSGIMAQGDDLFADPAPGAKPAAPAKPAASAPAAPAPAAPAAPVQDAAPAASDPATDVAPEAAAAESDGRGDNYLIWMIRSLGVFFTPVFICISLAMVALVTMNILAIRRSVIVPEELVRGVARLIDEQKNKEAYLAAKNDESLLGKMLSTGMARISAGQEKVEQAMQDVKDEETMRLQQRISYLALIGNLAPMVGLFGTVVGMIDSFQAIASGGAAPSPQKLAEGIATALFTTEIGLSIALPALAIYEIFKNRLDRYLLELGIVTDSFVGRFFNSQQPKR